MDDPDFSVSLVKLESTRNEEHIEEEMQTSSSWIGSSKDCHLLWESLRKQGQLFKVLDTLTSKTARLINRVQNQTASEDDSEVAVQLLSQLGVLFVEMETNEDGSKEKRYTFVTDVDPVLAKHVAKVEIAAQEVPPPPEPVPYVPIVAEESDDDVGDPFEQDSSSEKENTLNGEDEQTPKAPYLCDLCNEDLGSPVMLDFHKLRFCEIMKKSRVRLRTKKCPTCGTIFKQQTTLYNHLIDDHGIETAEAMQILRELETRKPDPSIDQDPTPPQADSIESVGMETSPKGMKCEICQEYFQNRIQLRTHLMEGHDFSRQKAVSSVSEAVKLAQQIQEELDAKNKRRDSSGQFKCQKCDSNFDDGPKLAHHMVVAHDMPQNKAHKTANKQQLELDASKFVCDLCTGKFSVRTRLSKHMVEVHDLDIKEVRIKVEQMYPRKIDAVFACDLCSVSCCKRFVLSRHFALKHGLNKRQVVKKTNELYPLQDSQRVSKTSRGRKPLSKEKGNVRDKQARHSLKGSLKGGDKFNKPERTSRRLAQKGKGSGGSNRDEADEKSHHEETEDDTSQEKTMEDDKEEQNGKESKTGDEENQDQQKDASDDNGEGMDDDEDEEDEDEEYIPSESNDEEEQLGGKKIDKSPRKRGRPCKNQTPDMVTLSVSDDEGKEKGEQITESEKSPRKRGRPRKNSSQGSDEEVKTSSEKPKKKRGRPSWKADPDGNYKCKKCNKTFQNLYYAKTHMTSIHKQDPAYNCSTCKKSFHFRNTFMRHLNCHKNEELGIKFTCDLCGKTFFDKYNLGTHIKTHNSEKPYKCEFCDRGFFHKSLLQRHRNLHTKDVEYRCNVCDKVFYRKGGLKYHMLSYHEKKKDHVCSHCGLGFASKSSLTAHEPTHTTDRPFQCDICGTRVKTKGNLKEHMMCVHTDKRDFKCDICEKTFNRSHRLTLHMMMHRDERPHKCHLCDKAFRTRTNLRVHIKWHQDQRDFQCEQCGKTFLIPGNLDRHMQTHKHGKVPKRKTRKNTAEEITIDLQNPTAVQLPLVTEVVPSVDNQYQTVHNIVADGAFESDLPTLASIAQHLSTMNIPVFQVPNTTTHGPIPVAINPSDSTCTPLPGSVMSSGASMALAAFGQVHGQQQLHVPSTQVTQAVHAEFEHIELTM